MLFRSSRVKSVIFDTNLQLLVLQKPRRTLLSSNPRSMNFEPPGIRCKKYFASRKWSCNNLWRSFGNFKLQRTARSTKVYKSPVRRRSCSWPRWLRTCGRSWRWINSGSLFGNSPRTKESSRTLRNTGAAACRDRSWVKWGRIETIQVYPREAYQGPRATSRSGSRNFTTSQRSDEADRAIS